MKSRVQDERKGERKRGHSGNHEDGLIRGSQRNEYVGEGWKGIFMDLLPCILSGVEMNI